MVETLKPRSALARVYRPGRFGAETETLGLSIMERRELCLVHLDAGEGDAKSALALAAALGLTLPKSGLSAENAAWRVLWLGSRRWMATGDGDDGDAARRLAAAAPGAAVNDVSSSRCVLRLSGPSVRDVLAAGCAMDLHTDVFTPGRVATTLIDHYTVTLDCIDADTFDLYVARGFAQSFFEWLTEAVEEYGYEVQ